MSFNGHYMNVKQLSYYFRTLVKLLQGTKKKSSMQCNF